MGHTVLANTVDADTSGSRNMPVLVQMDTGPLAGYRLEGSIEKHEDSLSVPINTLFGPDGRKIPVDALLVSPQTQETTVACDVNHHYFARIGVPALVGAVQGLGQAALLSGSTFAASPYGSYGSYRSFSPEQIAGMAAGGAANGVQGVLRDALPKGSTIELCPDAAGGNLFPVGCFVELTHWRPSRNDASFASADQTLSLGIESTGPPMTASAMADVQPLRARPHVSLPLPDAAASPPSETVAKPDQTSISGAERKDGGPHRPGKHRYVLPSLLLVTVAGVVGAAIYPKVAPDLRSVLDQTFSGPAHRTTARRPANSRRGE